MLRTRFLTALILLPAVLLAIIFMPVFYFAALFSVLIAIGAWEWSGLVGFKVKSLRIIYTILVMAGVLLANFSPLNLVLISGVLIWFWLFMGILFYQNANQSLGFSYPIIRSICGFVVLVSCWVAVIALRAHPGLGVNWLIFVLFLIWGTDVGAYFAGRRFGKRSLVSKVSPNKTWAGFVGGLTASLCVSCIGGLFFHSTFVSYASFLGVAFITALVSVVGDLGVSLLKRISGVKDTGNIIPGHGGVLDRIDSVAAATVVFVSLVLWLGW